MGSHQTVEGLEEGDNGTGFGRGDNSIVERAVKMGVVRVGS